MFCMSCKTNKVVTEYEYHVPEIVFPAFPKLGEFEIKGDKVEVDENYFRQLLKFRETYKSVVLEYEEKRRLYLEGEK